MGTGTGSIVDTVIAIIYPTKPTNECSEDKKKKNEKLTVGYMHKNDEISVDTIIKHGL